MTGFGFGPKLDYPEVIVCYSIGVVYKVDVLKRKSELMLMLKNRITSMSVNDADGTILIGGGV